MARLRRRGAADERGDLPGEARWGAAGAWPLRGTGNPREIVDLRWRPYARALSGR